MRSALIPLPALLLAACEPLPPEPQPEPLPLFGPGYRAEGDPCRRVGESPVTAEYLDDAADLVACPEDMENLGAFSLDTGGIEVARVQGHVLYSVPVR